MKATKSLRRKERKKYTKKGSDLKKKMYWKETKKYRREITKKEESVLEREKITSVTMKISRSVMQTPWKRTTFEWEGTLAIMRASSAISCCCSVERLWVCFDFFLGKNMLINTMKQRK